LRLKLLQIILTTIGWIKAKYISYHWPLHSKYIFLWEYIFIIIAEWTIRIYSDGNAYYFSKSYNIWLNYSGIFKNNMVIIFEWIITRIYLLTSNEYIYWLWMNHHANIFTGFVWIIFINFKWVASDEYIWYDQIHSITINTHMIVHLKPLDIFWK